MPTWARTVAAIGLDIEEVDRVTACSQGRVGRQPTCLGEVIDHVPVFNAIHLNGLNRISGPHEVHVVKLLFCKVVFHHAGGGLRITCGP